MKIGIAAPFLNSYAGLFISSGKGIHPTRIIDSYEIIFNVSGSLGMFEDGQKFDVSPNEALILEPSKKHGGTRPYKKDLSFYWIHFIFQSKHLQHKDVNIMNLPKQCRISRPEKMTELFREYLDMQESGTLTELHGSALICLMLSEIARSAKEVLSGETGKEKNSDEIASKVKTLINANVGSRDLNTSWIAEKLRCNPDYMGRVFKNVYGKTVTDEIHDRKINAAKRLLLNSPMNIKEIATACGFSDTIYFRRIFKKMTGYRPFSYRKQFSHMHVNTELN
ncbi:MAG: AraC family transcriptional regulator [Victivallales bacterium]